MMGPVTVLLYTSRSLLKRWWEERSRELVGPSWLSAVTIDVRDVSYYDWNALDRVDERSSM